MAGIFFLNEFSILSIFLVKIGSIWAGLGAGLLVVAFFAYASFDILWNVYVRAFCRKITEKKLVALTFDDGPHSVHTPRVLDVLKKYDVKATFFLIGKSIAVNEDILKRMHSEGHQTDNHSFSHKNSFPWFGVKKMAADMLQCEQAISRTTGYKTKWFRPPFGVTNPNVAKAVKMRGYKVAGWSIRSLDTVISDKNKIVRRIVSRLRPGAIVLMHDHLQETPFVLEQVIQQAKEKGYSFVSMEELSAHR